MLEKNIKKVVLFFCLLQITIILLIQILGKVSFGLAIGFICGTTFLHVGLAYFLILQKTSFINDETSKILERVNAPCLVTLFRISSLPTIVYLMIAASFTGLYIFERIGLFYPMLAILSFAFLTDFLDGMLARCLHQKTRIGRILDSVSDYILLTCLSGLYCFYGLIPIWLLAMVVLRLGLQAIGMFVFIVKKKPVEPTSTIGGKIAIASLMIGFVLELIIAVFEKTWNGWNIIDITLEIVIGVILFSSCFEKIKIFVLHKKSTPPEVSNL